MLSLTIDYDWRQVLKLCWVEAAMLDWNYFPKLFTKKKILKYFTIAVNGAETNLVLQKGCKRLLSAQFQQ